MSDLAWGNLIGVITVITTAVFIGIWIWAWRKRHRQVFKRLSEIPMEDAPEGPVPPVPAQTEVDPRKEDDA